MGLFDDDDLELDELLDAVKKYPSCVAELNEGNVQAIFNRCLAEEEDRKTTVWATLFPPELGYEYDPDAQVLFRTDALLQNKKNIEYLYGQLKEVHNEASDRRMPFWDFSVAYSGKQWTQEEQAILQLLHLGVNMYTLFIEPFRSEQFFRKGKYKQLTEEVFKSMYMGVRHPELFEPFRIEEDTSRVFKEKPVKPTLSPKDPAFPAWWEAHKGEWEDKA